MVLFPDKEQAIFVALGGEVFWNGRCGKEWYSLSDLDTSLLRTQITYTLTCLQANTAGLDH